jgi:hypothetical protein
MDGDSSQRLLHTWPSSPGLTGGSSTPQFFDSIISALEYWIARSSRAMTVACASAFSRRHAPESCRSFRPKKTEGAVLPQEGSREDRVRAAPAVSRAKTKEKGAHEHTGSAEAVRPSLRNGFTAYFVLSLATGFVVTIATQKIFRAT